MKLEPIIGLEIHIQLKTKSKMFCSCANIFGDVEPNSAVCPVCMGYPGTLPVPNKQAIEWTQVVGTALNCELASKSKFDRKHYFYPDLPKGYQISQYDQPFCGKGKFPIISDGKERHIGITRIHLEEDAAKNTHPTSRKLRGAGPKSSDYTLVDFNRAGTPLIEIVTEPDIRTPREAKQFLQELQGVARALGVSDADMEKGQMRCDANISLRERGSTELHPKTEIKNVNSFRFVERALEYEIRRHTSLWEKGDIPQHATRGYNSDKGITVEHRAKEEAADYRYFPEPDIPPFEFDEKVLNTIRDQLPELPWERRVRFERQYRLTVEQAQLLIVDEDLAHLFEDTVSEMKRLDRDSVEISRKDVPELVSLAARIILREVRDIIRKSRLARGDVKITAENLAETVALLHRGKMNSNAVRPVLDEMQRTGGDPDHILQNLGLEQVSGEGELKEHVQKVIDENPDVVEKIRAGKEGAIQFLVGQVMSKTGGRADPKIVIEMLRKKMNLRGN